MEEGVGREPVEVAVTPQHVDDGLGNPNGRDGCEYDRPDHAAGLEPNQGHQRDQRQQAGENHAVDHAANRVAALPQQRAVVGGRNRGHIGAGCQQGIRGRRNLRSRGFRRDDALAALGTEGRVGLDLGAALGAVHRERSFPFRFADREPAGPLYRGVGQPPRRPRATHAAWHRASGPTCARS